jgi:hypothetical protein
MLPAGLIVDAEWTMTRAAIIEETGLLDRENASLQTRVLAGPLASVTFHTTYLALNILKSQEGGYRHSSNAIHI